MQPNLLSAILSEAEEWELLSTFYETKGDYQAAADALREAEACYARIPVPEPEYSDLPIERPHKPRGGRQYGRLHQRRGGGHRPTDYRIERKEKNRNLGGL